MQDWMKTGGIRSHEITDESVFRRRRQLLQGIAGLGLSATGAATLADENIAAAALDGPIVDGPFSTDEPPSSYEVITTYNNFYELGLDKGDPVRYADRLRTSPWSVTVEGACEKPGTYTLEDILAPHPIEERVYRLRCVEAWSMVVPWNGFPLADLLKRFEPTSAAKYVAFETVGDQPLPGMAQPVLDWPYREGLRIDEAMHPLSFIATGVYGHVIPNQNGAPLRLVVPWKYGFKSIKSIVRIRFVDTQPPTSWNLSAPREYGFYSNVNPAVSHPRWSQARERRLTGEGGFAALFTPKIDTRFMNGYAEQVASLYAGMDLEREF